MIFPTGKISAIKCECKTIKNIVKVVATMVVFSIQISDFLLIYTLIKNKTNGRDTLRTINS